jgi:hypothetical protein
LHRQHGAGQQRQADQAQFRRRDIVGRALLSENDEGRACAKL